jgi:hypothetical protein
LTTVRAFEQSLSVEYSHWQLELLRGSGVETYHSATMGDQKAVVVAQPEVFGAHLVTGS